MLDNQVICIILLSMVKYFGSGLVDVFNVMFGWGVLDLNKVFNGFVQLLGVFNVNIVVGCSDIWSNDIFEVVLIQCKSDECV